ncbi:MAG: glucose-1-phosphate thymidylyltransferase [Proteobacteria bacterium]|nr:glucose-1-phosphate thymidylyltransferase [Pseudomonadota bacterium]NCA28184.1 glucose-1-phosphate thymidylyltransferase [Pseudomonadota bacterium]
MKGIILAGGSGTRLAPLTNITSKQLLPVYDKPMICYPLGTLMSIGIKDILIISTPQDTPNIEKFLGNGSNLGINIQYAIQHEPKGIAEAFIVGEKFVGDDSVCLILGDNIFYGSEFGSEKFHNYFIELNSHKTDAYIFAYQVSDPERYGVVELDSSKKYALSIEEKPLKPKSNWAVTGFYIYNNKVVEIAKNLKPSVRGELEITDVNKEYLKNAKLGVIKLGQGFAWLDAGTPDSLLDSAKFIQTIEKRQGLKIACLEEIAFKRGFINKEQVLKLIEKYKKNSDYRKYLETIFSHEI